MNDIVKQIIAKPEPLTREDIAQILASIGKPGTKRDEKTKAVQDVCQQKGTGTNTDGHGIWEDLTDFGAF